MFIITKINRIKFASYIVPFLQVQPQFHPKRNQARQKLATLGHNRFKDLASDVYHELSRRYGGRINEERAFSDESIATKDIAAEKAATMMTAEKPLGGSEKYLAQV
jgi:hypothetical protein